MIKVKKFQDSNINEGIKICLKHHLYVPTWSFQLWLTHSFYKIQIKSIFIIYKKDAPVGASIVLNNNWDVNVGFFIKPEFRRLGFGQKLMNTVVKNNKNYELRYDYGISSSRLFFENTTKEFDNISRVF